MQTNIFPIHYESESFQICRVPYDVALLQQLRREHNATHSFFSYQEHIYISNNDGPDLYPESSPVTLSIQDNVELTARLTRHVLFRQFIRRFPHIKPLEFHPLRFASTVEKDNLAKDIIPAQLSQIVSLNKEIELAIRPHTLSGIRSVGLVINTDYRWRIAGTVAELTAAGYQLKGLDVSKISSTEGTKNVLQPDEEFIGHLVEHSSESATVQTPHGSITLPANNLVLKRSARNVANLVGQIDQIKADSVIQSAHGRINFQSSPEVEHQNILRVGKSIALDGESRYMYTNSEGFAFTIAPQPVESGNSLVLKSPVLVFDPVASRVDNAAHTGIQRFGPWDQSFFHVKAPSVLCICHRNARGRFTKFMGALVHGVPDYRNFSSGMKGKYHLHKIDTEVIEITDYSLEAYLQALSQIKHKPNMVIVEIPFELKSLRDPNESPYYRIKSRLLGQGIPVQFIHTEKLQFNEYILDSIALQMYAKMGGTPWLMLSDQSIDRELIVGVGSSIFRNADERGAFSERVVGISTFFSGDGQYLLSNQTEDVLIENYFPVLVRSMKAAIERISERQSWRDGETVRLVFHIFKPIKDVEFEAICDVISSVKRFNIRFAIVTIGSNHPYRIYNPAQQGVQKRGRVVGRFVCDKGSNLIVDDHSCLIQMIGPGQFKTEKQGAGTPMLIRLRLPSEKYAHLNAQLFTDISYIVQQAYWAPLITCEQLPAVRS